MFWRHFENKGTPGRTRTCDPCLEGSSGQIIKKYEFASNIELLYSSSCRELVEACRKLLSFEDMTIYKIIYSAFGSGEHSKVNPR